MIENEKIKKINFYEYKWVVIQLIGSIIFFLLGKFVLNELWVFGGALLAGALSTAQFQLADDRMLGNVDTFQEIVVNKNIALGLYYVALALVIAIPFGSAFLVFLAI